MLGSRLRSNHRSYYCQEELEIKGFCPVASIHE